MRRDLFVKLWNLTWLVLIWIKPVLIYIIKDDKISKNRSIVPLRIVNSAIQVAKLGWLRESWRNSFVPSQLDPKTNVTYPYTQNGKQYGFWPCRSSAGPRLDHPERLKSGFGYINKHIYINLILWLNPVMNARLLVTGK